MDPAERVVRAKLMGKIDSTEGDIALASVMFAQTKIFCEITGKILDVTAMAVMQVWRMNPDTHKMQWNTLYAMHESFVDDPGYPEACSAMTAEYGEQDKKWRFRQTADVWEKIDA